MFSFPLGPSISSSEKLLQSYKRSVQSLLALSNDSWFWQRSRRSPDSFLSLSSLSRSPQLIAWRLYPMHAFWCLCSFAVVYFRTSIFLFHPVLFASVVASPSLTPILSQLNISSRLQSTLKPVVFLVRSYLLLFPVFSLST